MTRAELIRQRRQMHRRIRETLAERRLSDAMIQSADRRSRAPAAADPAATTQDGPPASRAPNLTGQYS